MILIYICVQDIDFASFYDFFLLDFGTVPTVWYFFVFPIFYRLHAEKGLVAKQDKIALVYLRGQVFNIQQFVVQIAIKFHGSTI